MQSAYTLPVWLSDEQMLRDEAVLFGLSEARPDDKIASIRLAFAALTAPTEKQIEQHHEAIGNLNLLIETTDSQLTNQLATTPTSKLGNWPVGTFALGLFLALLLCTCTYLGTLSLADTQLALLLAALAGVAGSVATLLISQAIYRSNSAKIVFVQHTYEETRRQLLADKVNRQLQKRSEIEQLYKAEAALTQHQAHRDLLIRLFESEFDLARSLRHQVRNRFVDL